MKHVYIILGLAAAFIAGLFLSSALLPKVVQTIPAAAGIQSKLGAAVFSVQDLVVSGVATTTGSIYNNGTTTTFQNGSGNAIVNSLSATTDTIDFSGARTCLVVKSVTGTTMYLTFTQGNSSPVWSASSCL